MNLSKSSQIFCLLMIHLVLFHKKQYSKFREIVRKKGKKSFFGNDLTIMSEDWKNHPDLIKPYWVYPVLNSYRFQHVSKLCIFFSFISWQYFTICLCKIWQLLHFAISPESGWKTAISSLCISISDSIFWFDFSIDALMIIASSSLKAA